MEVDWSDVLRAALAFFLVVTGVGIGYLCLRIAGVFGRLSTSVRRVTDEVVPILSKAQTTVDEINTELARVDEIMQTAVGATKGAERAVGTVSKVVSTPVKRIAGIAAGAQEALATFRARRASERAAREAGEEVVVRAPEPPAPEPPPAGGPATATMPGG